MQSIVGVSDGDNRVLEWLIPDLLTNCGTEDNLVAKLLIWIFSPLVWTLLLTNGDFLFEGELVLGVSTPLVWTYLLTSGKATGNFVAESGKGISFFALVLEESSLEDG